MKKLYNLHYEVWVGKGNKRRVIQKINDKQTAKDFVKKYTELSEMIQHSKYSKGFNNFCNPRIKKIDKRR